MTSETLLLLIGAIVPICLILVWTWRRDRLPEPPRVVLMTLLLGALATIPILFAEIAIASMLGLPSEPTTLLGAIAISFLVAALVEESFKFLVLTRYAATHSSFDEPYDGIVYGVAASLGFACVENVAYVLRAQESGFERGLLVAVARAVLAVPLHTSCGAIMGVCIGIARFKGGAARSRWMLAGFAAAIVVHGVYDTFAFAAPVAAQQDTPALGVIAVLGVITTTIVAMGLSIGGAAWLRRSQRLVPTNPPAAARDQQS
jgi:RsiW-degrading membrane proteinase PrsW (M82 family)